MPNKYLVNKPIAADLEQMTATLYSLGASVAGEIQPETNMDYLSEIYVTRARKMCDCAEFVLMESKRRECSEFVTTEVQNILTTNGGMFLTTTTSHESMENIVKRAFDMATQLEVELTARTILYNALPVAV